MCIRDSGAAALASCKRKCGLCQQRPGGHAQASCEGGPRGRNHVNARPPKHSARRALPALRPGVRAEPDRAHAIWPADRRSAASTASLATSRVFEPKSCRAPVISTTSVGAETIAAAERTWASVPPTAVGMSPGDQRTLGKAAAQLDRFDDAGTVA